jgi:hypothetical protein
MVLFHVPSLSEEFRHYRSIKAEKQERKEDENEHRK